VAELEREVAVLRGEVAVLKRAGSTPAKVEAHPQRKAVKAAKGRK
jgi:hypothetical protein